MADQLPYRQRVLRFRKEQAPLRGGTGHSDLDVLRQMVEMLKGQGSARTDPGPMPIPGATSDSLTNPTLYPTVLTPIDVDRSGPEFALDSTERNKWLKEVVESRLLSDGLAADEQMALGFLHEKILEPETISAAERTFWSDFISWMIGKPRRTEDRQRTPWLNNPDVDELDRNLATFTPSIARFLRVFIETRSRFSTQIEELKIRGPTNLVEAYLYYKYIIRGACDGFLDDILLMDMPMYPLTHENSQEQRQQPRPMVIAEPAAPPATAVVSTRITFTIEVVPSANTTRALSPL